MRGALWLIFLFAAAVVVALFAEANAGHVVIYFPPYRLDTSLNFFLVVLIVVFVACLVVWRTSAAILELPKQAAIYRRRQREARAVSYLSEAIEDIFAGRFSKALKAAELASLNPVMAETAALLAARAAHRLNELETRDRWLAKITSSQRQQAKLVATADMQMDAQDPQGALKTIEQLQKGGARQLFVQRIALKANQRLKRWEEVLRLTHSLAKRSALHPVVAEKTVEEAVAHLVQEKSSDHEALLHIWKRLPKTEQLASRITLVMAKGLLGSAQAEIAKELIEESLEKNWDDALVELYPQCAVTSGLAVGMMQKMESWMMKQPNQATLYAALGQLCFTQKLWGKAKSSFQQVLRDPKASDKLKARVHFSLAQLHEELGESEDANEHYRLAAQIYAK